MRSLSLQVKRNLLDQCYAAFLKFHTAISSVTGENLPNMEGWHDAYVANRTAMEPVADDLIALTHLRISRELADRVEALRITFRRWEGHYQVYQTGHPPQQTKAFEELVTTHPQRIRAALDDVTSEFRDALKPRHFRL